MFSEIHAEMEAKGLQKVLIAAIESKNKKIIAFCKKHVYPLYDSALGESFSSEISKSKDYALIKSVFEGS